MTVPPVVCNSSPLIGLHRIGQLDLLEKIFSTVLIPSSVAREIGSLSLSIPWIIERPPSNPISPHIVSASLGVGETEVIALAMEVGVQWVILDDRPARRLAETVGLPVIGTLGVLLACKRRGFVSAVRPLMDALGRNGFRISGQLYARLLSDAGEVP